MKYKLFRSPGDLDKAVRKHELVAVETGKNIDDVAEALIRDVRDDLAEMPEYAHCETAAYAPEPIQEHRRVRRYQYEMMGVVYHFNPRTPRGVRQQTLPKSREFAWLNLLICTRGRRLSIRKQTRLCSMKLSFMLFGCEPAGEGVSSWTSHATKSKVRLEGRSAYSQSVRSSAHSDFPGNKSGGCPVRDP